MATHSKILAWRIPRTEEPGGLQSTGSQRTGHDWATDALTAFTPSPLPALPPPAPSLWVGPCSRTSSSTAEASGVPPLSSLLSSFGWHSPVPSRRPPPSRPSSGPLMPSLIRPTASRLCRCQAALGCASEGLCPRRLPRDRAGILLGPSALRRWLPPRGPPSAPSLPPSAPSLPAPGC